MEEFTQLQEVVDRGLDSPANVDLISPEDNRWVVDDPGIPHKGVNHSLSLGVTPRAGRVRGAAKELPQLQNGAVLKFLDYYRGGLRFPWVPFDIEQVEKVFGASQPDINEEDA